MRYVSVLAVSALIVTGCMFGTENESDLPAHVGLWVNTLSPQTKDTTKNINLGSFVQEEMRIEMNIGETNTYELNVTYPESGETALNSVGSWSEANDTLYLDGSECRSLDSEGVLSKVECQVIPVPIEVENDIFLLSLKTLYPLAPSMGIDLPDYITGEMLEDVALAFERS
ncbi:MAG: hypothetical protein ACLFQB_01640 [Chitinispirillaceae bacterium]